MTDQELKDLVASLATKHIELTEAQRNTHLEQQETARQLRETEQETARQLRETQQETARQLREGERQLRESKLETDRQLRETDRQVKELGRQIGGLGDKFGSFTEGLALPAMQKILGQRFNMDVIAPRVRSRRNGHSLEVDVLAWSHAPDGDAYVVEVKSNLREEALGQMRKILRQLREFLPEHRDRKLHGILAAVDVPDDLREKVLSEGIYLARIHDDQFERQVPEGFKPRSF